MAVETFATKNPHPDKEEIVWANPDKVGRHLAEGLELVAPKDAKTYGAHPGEEKDGRILRQGLVLMRRPIILSDQERRDAEFARDEKEGAVEAAEAQLEQAKADLAAAQEAAPAPRHRSPQGAPAPAPAPARESGGNA